ncbi:unnamed protein product, partial [Vitis vinifera]|uniref:Uncharacterized protein n=1 Tax=Vitis vinifera TaxID=29760 RepID=D7SI64_VITVI
MAVGTKVFLVNRMGLQGHYCHFDWPILLSGNHGTGAVIRVGFFSLVLVPCATGN